MATTNSSQDALVGAARKLGPLLRENANQGERDRRLPAATVKGLTEAGFFRLCRPRELGGLEADPITVLNVVEEIARYDGSAAWCALNCSIASALRIVPGAGGDSRDRECARRGGQRHLCPERPALEVEGGYRLTGR